MAMRLLRSFMLLSLRISLRDKFVHYVERDNVCADVEIIVR